MESRNPVSKNYAYWVTSVHELCATYLKKTHDKMGRYYGKSEKAVPQLKSDDLVMLGIGECSDTESD